MFERATKKQSRLRLALVGPSGSGKTFTALAVATGLGSRIALIDTERGSAAKYAGLFQFDQAELDTFHPQKYIDAIREAERAYDVLIIDSLSHAWVGREGALELVDAAARRSKSGNSYMAWRDVTPLQNALVSAILDARCHVIATLRAKVEYVLDRDASTGKSVPRKVGLAPVQRDGMEYEFDVIGELDGENVLSITKTRIPELAGTVLRRAGADFGRTLAAWLNDAPALSPAAVTEAERPFANLPPFEQVRLLIDRAQSEKELRALLPLIVALPASDQKKLRPMYASRKEALAYAANGQQS